MSDLTPQKLYKIQAFLPEFRALDTIRNRKGLSPADGQKWSRLYGELLTLFDATPDFYKEARNSLRLPIRMRVSFSFKREQFFTMSHDLSVHGISVNCHHDVPLSSPVSMEIGLRSSRISGLWRSNSFKVNGNVIWLSERRNRIAFKFNSLSTAQRLTIEDCLYQQMETKLSLHINQESTS